MTEETTAWGKPIKPYFGRVSYQDPDFQHRKPLMHAFERLGDPGLHESTFDVVAKCGYKLGDFGNLRWLKKVLVQDMCKKCKAKLDEEGKS